MENLEKDKQALYELEEYMHCCSLQNWTSKGELGDPEGRSSIEVREFWAQRIMQAIREKYKDELSDTCVELLALQATGCLAMKQMNEALGPKVMDGQLERVQLKKEQLGKVRNAVTGWFQMQLNFKHLIDQIHVAEELARKLEEEEDEKAQKKEDERIASIPGGAQAQEELQRRMDTIKAQQKELALRLQEISLQRMELAQRKEEFAQREARFNDNEAMLMKRMTEVDCIVEIQQKAKSRVLSLKEEWRWKQVALSVRLRLLNERDYVLKSPVTQATVRWHALSAAVKGSAQRVLSRKICSRTISYRVANVRWRAVLAAVKEFSAVQKHRIKACRHVALLHLDRKNLAVKLKRAEEEKQKVDSRVDQMIAIVASMQDERKAPATAASSEDACMTIKWMRVAARLTLHEMNGIHKDVFRSGFNTWMTQMGVLQTTCTNQAVYIQTLLCEMSMYKERHREILQTDELNYQMLCQQNPLLNVSTIQKDVGNYIDQD